MSRCRWLSTAFLPFSTSLSCLLQLAAGYRSLKLTVHPTYSSQYATLSNSSSATAESTLNPPSPSDLPPKLRPDFLTCHDQSPAPPTGRPHGLRHFSDFPGSRFVSPAAASFPSSSSTHMDPRHSTFDVLAISDEDSREEVQPHSFLSYMRHMVLEQTPLPTAHASSSSSSSSSPQQEQQQHRQTTYRLLTLGPGRPRDKRVVTKYNYSGRGRELSELLLVPHTGELLTFDDRTGIVFECMAHTSSSDNKPATPPAGDADALLAAADRKKPKEGNMQQGYLTHEAADWSPTHGRWFFLPRRLSRDQAWDPAEDGQRGYNLLISCRGAFHDITVVKVKMEGLPERCFSAMRFVPGTGDRHIVATRTVEVNGPPGVSRVCSSLTVIDIDGSVLMPETFLGNHKFEGLEIMASASEAVPHLSGALSR